MKRILFVYLITLLVTLPAITKASAMTPEVSGQRVLRRYLRLHPPSSWDYDWTTAIFLYGSIRYCERFSVTSSACTFIDDFFSQFKREDLPVVTMPDLAAMALPATQWLPYASKNARANIEAILKNTKTFFDSEPLNRNHVFDHVGKRHSFYWWLPPTSWFMPSSVWADSAIMYGLNGIFLAKAQSDQKLEEFSFEQLSKIQTLLIDPTTGLYKHAYFISFDLFAPRESYWARGNGWIALSLVEALSQVRPENAFTPRLKTALNSLLERLQPFFDSENGFRTLLGSPSASNYFESSSSALYVYSLLKAIRLGLAPKDAMPLAKSYQEVLTRKYLVEESDSEVSVTGISGPTTAIPFDWYYTRLVPIKSDVSYGVGAFLLLLSESSVKQ